MEAFELLYQKDFFHKEISFFFLAELSSYIRLLFRILYLLFSVCPALQVVVA